jgi:hypothetical protein
VLSGNLFSFLDLSNNLINPFTNSVPMVIYNDHWLREQRTTTLHGKLIKSIKIIDPRSCLEEFRKEWVSVVIIGQLHSRFRKTGWKSRGQDFNIPFPNEAHFAEPSTVELCKYHTSILLVFCILLQFCLQVISAGTTVSIRK